MGQSGPGGIRGGEGAPRGLSPSSRPNALARSKGALCLHEAPPPAAADRIQVLAQFPEVVVALVTRVRCARDDRFPELKWTAFKAWTALLVERVEKGRTGVGQALAVDGLTVVADGAPTGARGRCR